MASSNENEDDNDETTTERATPARRGRREKMMMGGVRENGKTRHLMPSDVIIVPGKTARRQKRKSTKGKQRWSEAMTFISTSRPTASHANTARRFEKKDGKTLPQTRRYMMKSAAGMHFGNKEIHFRIQCTL